MKIIITGGGGFLGQKLARALLESGQPLETLVLADIVEAHKPNNDPRVEAIVCDLTTPAAVDALITEDTTLVFHLAAIVSSHAEADFDIGWKVNMDVTRNLLEKCRQTNPAIRFVFSSSMAVFGGDLPEVVQDSSVITPQSSYGAQKTIGELLVNDYARKGFVDARTLRLPTVCIRPGKPNLAASSFVSGVVREPLNGEQAICPVPSSLASFISSPKTIIKNLIHMSQLDTSKMPYWKSINAPGIPVTVDEMLDALESVTNAETRALVEFTPNETISKIVLSWPTDIDTKSALALGFEIDPNFKAILDQYMESDMPKKD